MIKKIIFYFCFFAVIFIAIGCNADGGIYKVADRKNPPDYILQKPPLTVKILLATNNNIKLRFNGKTQFTTDNNIQLSFENINVENGAFYGDGKYFPFINYLSSVNECSFFLDGKPYKGKIHISINENNTTKVILEISVKEYIKGVVIGEMPKIFHPSFAQVQAVLAYTYFIYKYLYYKNMGLEYIPVITHMEQRYVYKENPLIDENIKRVNGIIIMHKGKIFPAFYHSTCGGVTDNAYETFEDMRWRDVESLRGGIKCPFCNSSPHYLWNTGMGKKEMEKLFNIHCNGNLTISPVKKTTYGNIVKVGLFCDNLLQKTINAFEFRNRVGEFQLKSYNFKVEQNENNFAFSGSGFGHRVGLCQYGANEMIKLGYSYSDILKYYYPGITVVKIEEVWTKIVNENSLY